MSLRDKHVLVAVSGGIAAFKAVEIVRELGRRGARVKVALTPNAARFVGTHFAGHRRYGGQQADRQRNTTQHPRNSD